MIATLCPQASRATLTLVAAGVALGCSNAPPAASPASAPSAKSPEGSPKESLSGPRIVGTVLVSSSGKPPVNGGVVYLEDAPRQPGVAASVAISVDHKEFSPFISVMATGGTAAFTNKDALSHHVFSPDVPKWDTGYLNKNDTASRTFDSPGAVALLCNIHPEMLGYLLVIPSTYFGKLDASGKFVIAGVPPGTYRATAWAPRLPTTTQSVTVGTGAVTANFDLRPSGTTN